MPPLCVTVLPGQRHGARGAGQHGHGAARARARGGPDAGAGAGRRRGPPPTSSSSAPGLEAPASQCGVSLAEHPVWI